MQAYINELETEIDGFWEALLNGYNVESRKEIQEDCEASWAEGTSPLAVALHFVWKREPKVAELEAKVARLTSRGIEDMQFTIKELEAELAKHEWVSVEDRLPDDETEVLVLSMDDDETIFQMDLCSGRWRDECGQDVSGNPTHWMPIPALPEPPASKAETEMSNG
jgi:hypothetical protein